MLPKNSPPFLANIVMTGPGGPYNFTLPAIPEVSDYYGPATTSGFTVSNLKPGACLVTLTVRGELGFRLAQPFVTLGPCAGMLVSFGSRIVHRPAKVEIVRAS
jgi:hypothetical protein